MNEGIPQYLRFEVTDVLEKSLDDSGRPRRILGGYAAGTTRDFQDEQFLLKGMNFGYLTSGQGKINWDHNPRLVIGRPLYAGMNEAKGLYVKGVLAETKDYPNPSHPDVQAALEQSEFAWDQARRHKADPVAVPPLAWSVEGGKVNQNGFLVKSIITAVALTDQAVNPHDCTVQAMAKSLRVSETADRAVRIMQASEFPIEDVEDGKSLVKFFKSHGYSARQAQNFYTSVRSF